MGWDLCVGLFYEHRFAVLIMARLPKKMILCPLSTHYVFMCVLNIFYLANIKLHLLQSNSLCFMWLASSIQLPKESNSVSSHER